MEKHKKPTIKQKIAFNNLTEKIREKKPVKLGDVMIESGYTEATARNPEKNLTSKTGWQLLMASIDDKTILKRITEILIDNDKRASLQAADMLLKLKDKYPDKKFKIGTFQEKEDLFK